MAAYVTDRPDPNAEIFDDTDADNQNTEVLEPFSALQPPPALSTMDSQTAIPSTSAETPRHATPTDKILNMPNCSKDIDLEKLKPLPKAAPRKSE
jgi:hypothetical protein